MHTRGARVILARGSDSETAAAGDGGGVALVAAAACAPAPQRMTSRFSGGQVDALRTAWASLAASREPGELLAAERASLQAAVLAACPARTCPPHLVDEWVARQLAAAAAAPPTRLIINKAQKQLLSAAVRDKTHASDADLDALRPLLLACNAAGHKQLDEAYVRDALQKLERAAAAEAAAEEEEEEEEAAGAAGGGLLTPAVATLQQKAAAMQTRVAGATVTRVCCTRACARAARGGAGEPLLHTRTTHTRVRLRSVLTHLPPSARRDANRAGVPDGGAVRTAGGGRGGGRQRRGSSGRRGCAWRWRGGSALLADAPGA
jgi:hypothetical protein